MTSYVIRRARVLGGEPTDIAIEDGVITAIGADLPLGDATEVDATGLVARRAEHRQRSRALAGRARDGIAAVGGSGLSGHRQRSAIGHSPHFGLRATHT